MSKNKLPLDAAYSAKPGTTENRRWLYCREQNTHTWHTKGIGKRTPDLFGFIEVLQWICEECGSAVRKYQEKRFTPGGGR